MRFLAALLISALLHVAPASAVVVDALSEARVEVADQGIDARTAALRAGLAQAVVRYTGDRGAPEAADLATLMRNPQRFLTRYSYEEEPVAGAAPGQLPRLYLVARFDPVALERALREAGRAVWGRERPVTLLWLAIDDGATRSFVGAGGDDDAGRALAETAARRGLPVRYPAMDADDRAALAFADLWGGFEDRVLPAVARYGANFALAGAVVRSGTTWQARWLVARRDGSIERRTAQGGALPAVLATLLDSHADLLAAEYAVRSDPTQRGEVELAVLGVADLDAYARVVAYLESLSVVRGVQARRVAGDELDLKVSIAGEARHLEQTIALGTVLVPEPAATDEFGAAPAGLRYKYVP